LSVENSETAKRGMALVSYRSGLKWVNGSSSGS
jgi:hypothetical protein